MVYLDCNATTPMEPEVRDVMLTFMDQEFGNEGSRTHLYGIRAKQAVQKARDLVGAVVGAARDEVIFTSGATESNNLVILGLAKWAAKNGHKHIISTSIEHKATLEPLGILKEEGFEIDLIEPETHGAVDPEKVRRKIRKDTFLVSIIHGNNETGVIQPIKEISNILENHQAYLFIDAAQTYGKQTEDLKLQRIDLISASAHKIYGPKGIGALILKHRNHKLPPIAPIMFGGGQENGMRPGTLAVHLIAGFGKAAELALKNEKKRREVNLKYKARFLKKLNKFNPIAVGQGDVLANTINIRFAGISSEAFMVAMKNCLAVSNGSACTSSSYQQSHVLRAMQLSQSEAEGAIRFSWCHMTPDPNWTDIARGLKSLGAI